MLAKGTGVSILATLITGASKKLKQYSAMYADISAPIPPVKFASCNIKARFVLVIDFLTDSLSHGNKLLKSGFTSPSQYTNVFLPT